MIADSSDRDALVRRSIVRGSVSNALARAAGLLAWFVLAPLMLNRLGATDYGLWVVIGSVVGYGGLLDFGLGATLVKFVAEHRARGDPERGRATIATVVWLYIGLAIVALLATALLVLVLPLILNIPGDRRDTAAAVVLVMGCAVALALPCSAATTVLRGLQRFDVVAALAAAGTIVSALLTAAVLLLGGGVVAVVAVPIPVALATQLVGWRFVERTAPELAFTWRPPNWRLARTLAAYGTPLSIIDGADLLQRKTDEIVIGTALPVSSATPFALARALAELGRTLTSQFVQVLLPVASELQALNDTQRLRALYVTATRLSLVIFVPVGVTLLVLPHHILMVWVGAEIARSSYLVIILAPAAMLVTSQSAARWILQGIGRHRPLAAAALASGAANVVLSVALVRPLGLMGVALGTLIPMALESVCFVLPYATRVLHVSAAVWARSIALPALLPVLPQAVVLYGLGQLLDLDALLPLASVILLGWFTYVAGYLLLCATPDERELFRRLTLRNAPS